MNTLKKIYRNRELYLILLPALIYFIVFCYFPMYGIQIAFKDYKAASGIAGSAWVGLKHFRKFFSSYYCGRMFKNTFLLNVLTLVIGMPVPLILALMLQRIRNKHVKNALQASIIVPHFISVVVIVGMIQLFFSPTRGIVNAVLTGLFPGREPVDYMLEADWFRPLYILSDIWQNAGWNTLIYTAALNAIDPVLYEAAAIDGADRRQILRYIDLPHLIPTAVIVLILGCGSLLSTNVDKVLLMQTPGNMAASDILGVYVYSVGIASGRGQYSYASAIGLLLNVLNFVTLLAVNAIARKVSDTSLL